MVRPGIFRRDTKLRGSDCPRENPADIADKRLIEIQSRSSGQQDRRELSRQSVENVAPVGGAPHLCTDLRDRNGVRDEVCETAGTAEGEKETQGYLHRRRDGARGQRWIDDTCKQRSAGNI